MREFVFMDAKYTSLGPLGAEIGGLDISRPLSRQAVASLLAAWHDHLVLVFREQNMNDETLVAFSRNFGTLEKAPVPEKLRGGFAHVPKLPEVAVVSNVVENGVAIGALGDGELVWHNDMTYLPNPPPASVLCAVELPPAGGDTWFCNMYLAYETLPAALHARIAGLSANHDSSYTSAGTLRKGFEEVADVSKAPGAMHPLVLTHPETGRKALYLGRRRNAYVAGMPLAESEALLDELWAHATQEKFAMKHGWRLGDVVMWDNRCTMHRRDAFDPAARRILHRTQLLSA
jgi:taurine dioxygenase